MRCWQYFSVTISIPDNKYFEGGRLYLWMYRNCQDSEIHRNSKGVVGINTRSFTTDDGQTMYGQTKWLINVILRSED